MDKPLVQSPLTEKHLESCNRWIETLQQLEPLIAKHEQTGVNVDEQKQRREELLQGFLDFKASQFPDRR